jgi:hypothetical protein
VSQTNWLPTLPNAEQKFFATVKVSTRWNISPLTGVQTI